MGRRTYNAERRSWRGKSYKRGGVLIFSMRQKIFEKELKKELRFSENM